MTTEQNKAIADRIVNEGINSKDMAIFDDLIAPEFEHRTMHLPKPGPAGFRALVQSFHDAFPDMHIEVQHTIGEGDMVGTWGIMTGTNKGSFMGMPATGRKINIQYIDMWRLKDGKAVENWVQMDNTALMQQLGVMPS